MLPEPLEPRLSSGFERLDDVAELEGPRDFVVTDDKMLLIVEEIGGPTFLRIQNLIIIVRSKGHNLKLELLHLNSIVSRF